MRPPDDNPPGSTSPQIIPHTRSSKDGQNETTLSRLERAGPRRSASGTERAVRIALLGGSGLLVVTLIGSLVSLTNDSVDSPPVLGAAETEAPIAASAVAPERPAPIIDERDERNITTVDTADPPALVRLTSDQGDRPEPQTAAPAPVRPAAVVAATTPPVKARAAPLAAALAPLAPARKTAALVKPAKPAKPPTLASSTRKARPAPPAIRTEAPVVDTDVALLSAILMQSSRHASERMQSEAGTCAEAAALNRRCTDKPTVQRR